MVLALFALFSAVKLNRFVLILTSRNHTAWDITQTIWNYAQRVRSQIDNKELFKRLVIHHYSITRPESSVPLETRLKTKGKKYHQVLFFFRHNFIKNFERRDRE